MPSTSPAEPLSTMRWSDIAAGRKAPLKITDKGTCPGMEVFGVTELCEHILLYLSEKEILRVRAVARQFRDTVDGSSSLRKTLFLAVDHKALAPRWRKAADAQFLTIYSDKDAQRLHSKRALLEGVEKEAVVNSFLFHNAQPLVTYRRSKVGQLHDERPFHVIVKPDRLPQDALARSMFLSQPPATKVRLFFQGRRKPADTGQRGYRGWTLATVRKVVIENEKGVELEQIVEELSVARVEHGSLTSMSHVIILDVLTMAPEEAAAAK